MNPAIGAAAALGSAAIWSISSTLLTTSVRAFGSRQINVFKSTVAGVLFLMTVALAFGGGPIAAAMPSISWFAVSGFVGLALGDTFYLASLKSLGPTTALVLYQTSSLFTMALGFFVLNERPSFANCAGAVCVAGGVSLATWSRTQSAKPKHAGGTIRGLAIDADVLSNKAIKAGILLGLGSAASQAIGVVINRQAFEILDAAAPALRAAEGLASLERPVFAATVRLVAASAVMLLFAVLRGQARFDTSALLSREGWRLTLIPTVLGTYLGILGMQVAVGSLPAGIAATLLATPPIFSIPVAWIMIGERPTILTLIGTLIATGGVFLVST